MFSFIFLTILQLIQIKCSFYKANTSKLITVALILANTINKWAKKLKTFRGIAIPKSNIKYFIILAE